MLNPINYLIILVKNIVKKNLKHSLKKYSKKNKKKLIIILHLNKNKTHIININF